MDEMYESLLSEEEDGDERIIKHKEEMPARKHLNNKDRELGHAEIMKYDHPLEDTRPYLVNPVTGKRASSNVNVQNSKEIGDKMVQNICESLPVEFHNKISSKIVTMAFKSNLKTARKSTVMPLEIMCPNLLIVGQKRNISLKQMLSHGLCAQPPNIINRFGYLRKSAKAPIVKKLSVGCTVVDQPDAVMIDVSQLFYHIVWPCGGSISHLVSSITEQAAQYPKNAEKILVLDKHQDGSANEHERLRRGKEETNEEYDLTINCNLQKREGILTNTHIIRELGRILQTYNYGENVETDADMFQHDEANITIISHVLRAASEGQKCVKQTRVKSFKS